MHSGKDGKGIGQRCRTASAAATTNRARHRVAYRVPQKHAYALVQGLCGTEILLGSPGVTPCREALTR